MARCAKAEPLTEERSPLSDLQSLYIYSSKNSQKIPLMGIASLQYDLETQRINRLEHFRQSSVIASPETDVLPSEDLKIVKWEAKGEEVKNG
jgi:multidrug efflux pump subunit AcrB